MQGPSLAMIGTRVFLGVGAWLATIFATGAVVDRMPWLDRDDRLDPPPSAAPAKPARPARHARFAHATSAEAILTRNPFDSARGPLVTGCWAAHTHYGVHERRDGIVEITRAVLDRFLEEQADAMPLRRPVPRDASRTIPIVVRRGSTAELLGFAPGDRVVRVDSFTGLDDPDRALRAYATLRAKGGIEVELLRDGKPRVLHFAVC